MTSREVLTAPSACQGPGRMSFCFRILSGFVECSTSLANAVGKWSNMAGLAKCVPRQRRNGPGVSNENETLLCGENQTAENASSSSHVQKPECAPLFHRGRGLLSLRHVALQVPEILHPMLHNSTPSARLRVSLFGHQLFVADAKLLVWRTSSFPATAPPSSAGFGASPRRCRQPGGSVNHLCVPEEREHQNIGNTKSRLIKDDLE